VYADFRRWRWTALALLPTLLTAAALPAGLKLLGVSFNPLNVVALPVVLGIAVDDGVHLVHRYLRERGDLRATLAGAGRSIVLTSATTVAAFGALAFARHRGLASFGLAIGLGVTLALLLSVLVLPPVLAWVGTPDAAERRG
jgi:predicted RND superfamily exporter protein